MSQGATMVQDVRQPPALVATLPTDPYDGQECYYLADAANGVVWHLRYRAAAVGAYKWEVVGGPPLYTERVQTTGNFTLANTWHDPDSGGPFLTIPLAGDYMVAIGFRPYISTAANYIAMSYAIGGTAAISADWCLLQDQSTPGTGNVTRTRLKTFTAATTALAAKYLCSAGGTYSAEERWMQATPRRVG